MESFLASYGLDMDRFQELLQTTRALVAGSAPLALYLQQNGIPPGFVPCDIDIWIEDTREMITGGGIRQRGNLFLYTDMLVSQGFHCISRFSPPQEEDEDIHHITRIHTFRKNDKDVQLIFLDQSDIWEYMLRNFDLSICMTWWNAAENTFETMWPEETRNKVMYYYPTRLMTVRETERLDKYKARGFSEAEMPCPFLGSCDRKVGVDAFRGVSAFDIFAYEDVDAAEHLKSSYHLLLRVGSSFYAFHRETLAEYLHGHKVNHPTLGWLHDTPHKQTVLAETLTYLPFSDYSVVELMPEYVVGEKTIHRVNFYTVEGWNTGNIGCSVVPASHEAASHASHLAPASLPLHHPDVYWMG